MHTFNKNAITTLLREKTGLTIAQFAKNNGVSRKTIYNAINGGGSRIVRVSIAKVVNNAPSKLWDNNDLETQIIDDLFFVRS